MKHFLTIVLAIGLLTTTFAQEHEWEIGLLLGGSNIGGDLIDPDLSTFKETKPAFGLQAKKILNRRMGIRLGYYHGKLTGKDSNYKRLSSRGFSFTSPVHEFSALAEWDMLGHKRYRGEQFKKTISPYLMGGLGFSYFNPKTDFGNSSTNMAELIAEDQAVDVSALRFVIPLGAGVKMDLNPQWSLGLEYGFRISFSDYLDGVSRAGNPNKNDWYGMGGINLNYRLSKRDTDKDGTADAVDKCPLDFGIPSLQGCPDGDMDGIADVEDNCPALAGIALYGGCPDTDGDGILDPYDDCPETSGIRERAGCPIYDTDSDGIEDRDDLCPAMAGPANNEGCPYPDTDEDGILDKDDRCPALAGSEELDGCPDADGDGIADQQDDCPKILGTLANKGCPEISKTDVEILTLATESIEFETAKYRLKESSHATLDQIVEILEKYPQYELMIKGYTDDRGDKTSNRKLSENRAFACMVYFSMRGIDARRLSYKGFGEADPIASNNTASGRARNRRVTFELLQDNKLITSGR